MTLDRALSGWQRSKFFDAVERQCGRNMAHVCPGIDVIELRGDDEGGAVSSVLPRSAAASKSLEYRPQDISTTPFWDAR
jgi:hypothetical protein